MKNVTNVSSSAGNQLRRVRRKWWKLGLERPLRAAFTTEGATDAFDDIVAALESKKPDHELFIVLSREGDAALVRKRGGAVPRFAGQDAPHM